MAVTFADSAITEAEKAAVTGEGSGLVHFSMPIEKSEDTKTINPVDGTPDIEIWGKVTDGTLDSDLQVVDPEASLKWIKTWYDTKANIRMGHDPKRPVGRGLEIDGHYVKALIAEPVAKHLIRSKVLNDWSVGIINPDIRTNDPRFRHLDPTGKAIHGVITDRPDGLTGLAEISVVDRGSNYGTAFQLVKAAADGSPEWSGKLTAPDDVLAKVTAPAVTKDSGLTSVELPSDMKLKLTPLMLAKMATFKRDLVLREQEMKAAAADVTKAAEPEQDLRDLQAMMIGDEARENVLIRAAKAAEAGIYKRDIDTATRRRLASEGKALPNLSYPIETAGDLENAADLARSGHGDVPAASRLIGRRAKDLGVPNPMKKPKAKKSPAVKAAEPDLAKCGKCGDTGMVGDKPCKKCKSAKAAVPDAEKKKGKMRAICPSCGAKQNPDHKHCPECGNALPARAVQVKKNHDFVCLGCGGELDKGEPHCPGCGKENPGYLPEADRKIPANEDADKAAKERVSSNGEQVTKAKGKGGKKAKGGKKKPFGGNQAKPFGAKDGDDNKPDAKEPEAKKAADVAEKGKGGKKGKGRSPAEGVAAHAGTTAPLPPHREPDGAPVERFEDDAHLEDGDQQMKAAVRHKSLDMPPELALLHDLTCPAFSPQMTAKAFPGQDFKGVDPSYWQAEALKAAAEPDIAAASAMYNEMAGLSKAALTLKTADPQLLHDLRTEAYQAFCEANKAFRDATPGPGSFPTPGNNHQPGSFRRPYISGGHAAASPQYEPARSFPVITDHPAATDYQRGYISGDHAAQSPDNAGAQNMPDMRPPTVGQHANVPYQGTMRDQAQHSLSTMHDHMSRRFPDVCPMSPQVSEVQKPGRPVEAPVGGPVPHGSTGKASKADRAAAKAAAKAKAARKAAAIAKRKAVRNRAKVQSQVLKGKLSIDEGRAKLGLEPFGTPEAAQKAAVPYQAPGDAPAADVTAEAITAAVIAATAPLLRRQAKQDKLLRKTRQVVKAIGDQPDTSQAPFRGAGTYVNKTSAAPAAPRTVTEAAELAQNTKLAMLYKQLRDSPDPSVREAAWPEIQKMLGTQTMNTPDPTMPVPYHPQR